MRFVSPWRFKVQPLKACKQNGLWPKQVQPIKPLHWLRLMTLFPTNARPISWHFFLCRKKVDVFGKEVGVFWLMFCYIGWFKVPVFVIFFCFFFSVVFCHSWVMMMMMRFWGGWLFGWWCVFSTCEPFTSGTLRENLFQHGRNGLGRGRSPHDGWLCWVKWEVKTTKMALL